MISRWPPGKREKEKALYNLETARALDAAPAIGNWEIRYQLPGQAEPIIEKVGTKQMARDRYFTVKQFAGLNFCELRGPGGKLWFRDHFFNNGSPP